jgi:hypothetical protein
LRAIRGDNAGRTVSPAGETLPYGTGSMVWTFQSATGNFILSYFTGKCENFLAFSLFLVEKGKNQNKYTLIDAVIYSFSVHF